jgi:lipoprotein-anchoring transpeptidase ErfK/SrfK
MNTDLLQAQKSIQNAREALRNGDRSAARRWAEQAAKLAPQLEDPWLILAAVASPRASVSFIERALQINPNSPRARKGMQWALVRLQEGPSAQKTQVVTAKQAQSAARSVSEGVVQSSSKGAVLPASRVQAQVSTSKGPAKKAASKKPARTFILPVMLLALGCIAVIFAAWTASANPALASILSGVSQPQIESHPKMWAQVEIAKPPHASETVAQVADLAPTLSPPTPTVALPTPEPTEVPTLAPASPTPEPELETQPTPAPEATVTPSGALVMDIVVETAIPTSQPADDNAAPTARPQPPVGNGERWIEVNLSEQRLYAWEGDVLLDSFLVSTGTWATPTVTGTFSIWNKTPIQAMSGPGYYLPNVPYVMYFYKDYGIHGTYWHNNFGTPMSHGCVNMTIPDAEWLYNWASYGTVVKVHY